MDKSTFVKQPRYVVRYLGAIVDDARMIAGIWYSREGSRITRLGCQTEVRIVREIPSPAEQNLVPAFGD